MGPAHHLPAWKPAHDEAGVPFAGLEAGAPWGRRTMGPAWKPAHQYVAQEAGVARGARCRSGGGRTSYGRKVRSSSVAAASCHQSWVRSVTSRTPAPKSMAAARRNGQ